MPIEGSIIRPPSEAASGLLQLTKGCSLASCSFCGAYSGKDFSVKSIEKVYADIDSMYNAAPGTRRIFLTDGDALAAPDEFINSVLDRLNSVFPRLTRISSYVNAYNINKRTKSVLNVFRNKKFSLMYLGLESGSDRVLKSMRKPVTAENMLQSVKKAKEAGIKSSVILLLGLGSKKLQKEHMEQSAHVLNAMQPDYLSFLSLMLVPGTELYDNWQRGKFELLDPDEVLREMYRIIEKLELVKTVFRSDHASNYLVLSGRFPKDKGLFLERISAASSGRIPLRPDYLRGL